MVLALPERFEFAAVLSPAAAFSFTFCSANSFYMVEHVLGAGDLRCGEYGSSLDTTCK